MKRGLVLEGGGAKGSYALGCLLAFNEKGIKFDVVSGTSVGALNAAIVGTNKIQLAKEFWEQLDFKAVCSPTGNPLTWIILPFHLLSMFLHHVSFIGSLPFSSSQSPKKGYNKIFSYTLYEITVIGFILFLGVFFVKPTDISEIINLFLILTVLILCTGVLWAVPYFIRQVNQSIFSVEPLRCLIKEFFKEGTFSIPTYVTITKRQEMFDPDSPGYYIVGGDPPIRGVMSKEENVPHYQRVDNLSLSELTEILTASAAIPFGIFPSVNIDGEYFVDGGIADNIPLYPILESHNCDEIYIIRLRPHINSTVEENWKKVERRLRVGKIDKKVCKKLYNESTKNKKSVGDDFYIFEPPKNVPYKNFPIDKKKVVIISPKESLGTFLSGTMNFNARYTRKLIMLGYKDTCNIIEGLSTQKPMHCDKTV